MLEEIYTKPFFIKAIPALTVAVLGGALSVLRAPEELSLQKLFVGVLGSLFVGMVVFLLLQDSDYSDYSSCALVGLAGYLSNQVLQVLSKQSLEVILNVLKMKGINIVINKNNKDDREC